MKSSAAAIVPSLPIDVYLIGQFGEHQSIGLAIAFWWFHRTECPQALAADVEEDYGRKI